MKFKLAASLQRKPPAKRAFMGIAGSPLAHINDTPIPATEPKRGRGRPRVHENNADKQAAYRENKQNQIVEDERRELISKLIGVYNRNQDKQQTVGLSNKRIGQLREQARIQRAAYVQQLDGMTVEQLRDALQVGAINRDLHGKPSIEDRTGQLAAVAELNNVVKDLHGDTVVTYGTGKVSQRTPSILKRSKVGSNKFEELLYDTIDIVIAEHRAKDASGRCPYCEHIFPVADTFAGATSAELSEHMMLMFRTGEKQYEAYLAKVKAMAGLLPVGALVTTEYSHYQRLYRAADDVLRARKREARRKKRNIVTMPSAT